MVFLLLFFLSLIAFLLFFITWKRLPVSWLFDVSDLSSAQRRCPHPKSQILSRPCSCFLLSLLFFAVVFLLFKKVALRDVFWGLSLFWFLTHIALADFHYRLIPDQWSLGIAFLGFLRLSLSSAETSSGGIVTAFCASWMSHVPALILCGVLTLFLHILPQLLSGTPALGLGDVKLLFALAVFLAFREYLTLLTSAALLGGAAAAVMILRSRLRGLSLDQGIPYGTVIAASAFLSLVLY